jgi:hypothetical protein
VRSASLEHRDDDTNGPDEKERDNETPDASLTPTSPVGDLCEHRPSLIPRF